MTEASTTSQHARPRIDIGGWLLLPALLVACNACALSVAALLLLSRADSPLVTGLPWGGGDAERPLEQPQLEDGAGRLGDGESPAGEPVTGTMPAAPVRTTLTPTRALTRSVTATPLPPRGGDAALAPAVDWPDTPDLSARAPLTQTEHFRVFAAEEGDALLERLALRWAPELETIHDAVRARLEGRELPRPPVDLAFARSYPGRCPARGLAATGQDPPLLMVFVDEGTDEVQIRAVLAHEIGHHLTLGEPFIGDGLLTEGIANWSADAYMLAWQGFPSWEAAVRAYIAEGGYISITDDTALNPRGNEACIPRRDRVYNIRTAFVDWLIERIGLDRVMAMPVLEVTWVDPDSGEEKSRRLPDYERVTGASLEQLERLWLLDLRRRTNPEAW